MNPSMRFLSYLTALLMTVFLAACGGGGGSAGTSSGSAPPALFTSAPSALALPVGVIQEYTIRGGFAPYTIKNNNSRIAAGFVRNGNLILNAVSQGQSTVTIVDDKGTSIAIAVTVGTELKLSLDSLKSFVGDVVNVGISGGTPPYRTSTLDLAVKAVVNQNVLTLTLGVVSEVDVVVLDANDQTAKVKVTVITGTPQIRLSPSSVSVSESDNRPLIFTVFGAAQGPLAVRSSDPTLLEASISGNTMTVVTGTNGDRCVVADKPVTFEVVDSRGAFANALVVITNSAGGCSDLVAPAGDFVVQAGTSRSVVLGGDAQTGYLVSSDNALVATATYSGGVLTVTGVPWVCPKTVPAVPPATGETCATPEPASRTATITVTDIAHPGRNVSIRVSVISPT